LEPNDFLLKIIEKDFKQILEKNETEFSIDEPEFYKKGKKIDSSSTDIIDKIKEELIKNKNTFFKTNQKNEAGELLSLSIVFNQYYGGFTFTLLTTKSEIENLNNREKLRQELFEKELVMRILGLTDKQSVTLINDVLGSENLPWIKAFKKGKLTRDGGIDFTATICVDKNDEINFEGYGKWHEVYGQLKHLKKKMSESAMRDLIGTMTKSHSKIHFGFAISSRGFSEDCKRVIVEAVSSRSNKIKAIFCLDIKFISKLMIKHKIELYKHKIKSGLFVDEEWWNEIKTFTS